MKIAVDAMGGDHAPRAAVEGAHAAAREGAPILLVGDQPRVEDELRRLGGTPPSLELIHAEEVVQMDEPATAPLRRKRRSSIRICAELVKEGRAQAMVSAGNTGAVMAAAKLVIGTIPGIDRPALAAVLPHRTGRTVFLDVGANVDSKSRHLRQFAVMGHCYAQEVLGLEAPRIGLLSIGEEEGKGTDLTRKVFQILKTAGLNFAGNVEGTDVFAGTVDVIVCDGFVGNVVLKSSESLAKAMARMLEDSLRASLRTKIGAALAMPALAALKERTDPNSYGAAPLLGIEGGCFIGHGRSNALGIRNSIRRAVEFASAEVHRKIGQRVAVMHAREVEVLGGEAASG